MNDHQQITAERGRRAADLRAAAVALLEQQAIASGVMLDLDSDQVVAAGPKAAILCLLSNGAPAATKPTADSGIDELNEFLAWYRANDYDGIEVARAAWLARSLLATKPAAATTGWGLAPVEGKKTLEDAARKLVTYSHIYTGDKQASRLAVELSLMAEMMSRSPAASTTGAAQTAEQVRMAEIGQLIATQDNRITEAPIFVVEQKTPVVSDSDYNDCRVEWRETENGDYQLASPERAERLEALHRAGRETPGWRRYEMADIWTFVTACFTEQGCLDYLTRNGHNLRETRIYAYGSYRNEEFRAIRNFLMSLRPTPTHSSEAGATQTTEGAGK